MRVLRGGLLGAAIGAVVLAGNAAGVTPRSAVMPSAGPWPPDAASLTITSDPGDILGGGGSYAYQTPGDEIASNPQPGTPTFAWLTVGPSAAPVWQAAFGAPPGQALSVGHYADASDAPSGDQPFMYVARPRNGCLSTGDFTVNSITWDPRVWLDYADISFNEYCWGGPVGIHGRMIQAQAPPPPLTISTRLVSATYSPTKDTLVVRGTIRHSELTASPSLGFTCTQGTTTLSGFILGWRYPRAEAKPYRGVLTIRHPQITSGAIDCTYTAEADDPIWDDLVTTPPASTTLGIIQGS
jgi:hypothetical protein